MDRPLLWLNISVTVEFVVHHFFSESNIFIIFFWFNAVFYTGSRLLSSSKVFIEYCQVNEMKSNCFQFHTNLIVIVDTERLKQHIDLTHWTGMLVIIELLLLYAHHDRHH